MKLYQIKANKNGKVDPVAIRKQLKLLDLDEYGSICSIGDKFYLAHSITKDSMRVNVLANKALKQTDKDNQSFIAIDAQYSDDNYKESLLVSALFIKDGVVIESRTGQLEGDLLIYILQQLTSQYNERLTINTIINTHVLDELARAEKINIIKTELNVSDDDYQVGFYDVVSLHEIYKKYKPNPLAKISYFILGVGIVATVIASVIHINNSRVEVTEVTRDPYLQYRKSLEGYHATEAFNQAITLFNEFTEKEGWSITQANITQNRYTATLEPTSENMTVTPFVMWYRENHNDALLFDDKSIVTEGVYTGGQYMEGFKRWIIDLNLNLAQLQDIHTLMAVDSFDISNIKNNKNYRTAELRLTSQSLSINDIAKLYKLYSRLPLLSKVLEMTYLGGGVFAIDHTMILIGQ